MDVTVFQPPDKTDIDLFTGIGAWREFLLKREKIEERYAKDIQDLRTDLAAKLNQVKVDNVLSTEAVTFLSRLKDEEMRLGTISSRAHLLSNIAKSHAAQLQTFQDLPYDKVAFKIHTTTYKGAKEDLLYNILKATKKQEVFDCQMGLLVKKEKKMLGGVKPVDYVLRFEAPRFLDYVDETRTTLAKYTHSLQKCIKAQHKMISAAEEVKEAWVSYAGRRCDRVLKTVNSFIRTTAETDGILPKDTTFISKSYECDPVSLVKEISNSTRVVASLPYFKEFSPMYSIQSVLGVSLPEELKSRDKTHLFQTQLTNNTRMDSLNRNDEDEDLAIAALNTSHTTPVFEIQEIGSDLCVIPTAGTESKEDEQSQCRNTHVTDDNDTTDLIQTVETNIECKQGSSSVMEGKADKTELNKKHTSRAKSKGGERSQPSSVTSILRKRAERYRNDDRMSKRVAWGPNSSDDQAPF